MKKKKERLITVQREYSREEKSLVEYEIHNKTKKALHKRIKLNRK